VPGRHRVVHLQVGSDHGTGFLIAPGRLVTALHVVARVVNGQPVQRPGLLRWTIARLSGDGFSFESESKELAFCCVKFDSDHDWIVLECDPTVHDPVCSRSTVSRNARWQAYGFPGIAEGTGTEGTVVSIAAERRVAVDHEVVAIRVLQLHSPGFTDEQKVAGFSGAPVWQGDHVVGMLVHVRDGGGRMMFACPIEQIVHGLGIEGEEFRARRDALAKQVVAELEKKRALRGQLGKACADWGAAAAEGDERLAYEIIDESPARLAQLFRAAMGQLEVEILDSAKRMMLIFEAVLPLVGGSRFSLAMAEDGCWSADVEHAQSLEAPQAWHDGRQIEWSEERDSDTEPPRGRGYVHASKVPEVSMSHADRVDSLADAWFEKHGPQVHKAKSPDRKIQALNVEMSVRETVGQLPVKRLSSYTFADPHDGAPETDYLKYLAAKVPSLRVIVPRDTDDAELLFFAHFGALYRAYYTIRKRHGQSTP